MRFCILVCLAAAVLFVGCGQQDASSTTPAVAPPVSQSAAANTSSNDGPNAVAPGPDASVALTPANTTIQFVGTHADPNKPDPRTGRFTQFSGNAVVEESELESLKVEIDTASLTTEIDKLTNHLKSADFFDVNEHPSATFTSTSIEPADSGEGTVTIKGDLTLLGVTKPISFPATVRAKDGFALDAAFSIDRTQFGMDYGADKVLKEVQMTVTIGL